MFAIQLNFKYLHLGASDCSSDALEGAKQIFEGTVTDVAERRTIEPRALRDRVVIDLMGTALHLPELSINISAS